jgi:hypothetical protein
MLSELGDWLVEGFEADELPETWSFRCRARGPRGVTLVRFFRVTDGVLEPVVSPAPWRPSFVEDAGGHSPGRRGPGHFLEA